ncbi:MAG: hypothetical protein IJS13_10215 [Paludibacteraceae bacterium]|nr:hypothetical protein [Paludibacteraceae bacterium]
MRKTVFSFLAALLLFAPMSAKVKVHTIGDSTMADYDESTTDKRGWCTYLGSFFDPQFVEVNNRGKSGASSRTFYDQAAYWQSVKQQMTAGDYVLIQFAHNDENNNGLDVVEYNTYLTNKGEQPLTDLRGTCPNTTYKEFLRLYVDETRALGCTPVLVAPICRKYFSGNSIRRNGQHDLGDKFSKLENGVLLENQSVPATDHSMDYVYQMQQVAQEKNVTFIDLTSATRDLYLEYGEAQCTSLLFCQGDNTHTATLGANLIARLAAQLLSDAGVLSQYIDIPTSITATPAALSIGDTYSGVQQSREVLLTGFGLEPAAGNVSISASENLLISTDNETFAATAQAAYEGSTLFQRIYVHALYSEGGNKEDSLVITSGSARIVVPVTANVLSLAGGTAVSAHWAIDAKPVPAPVVTGPISAEMTLSNMVAWDTKSEFTDGDASDVLMVRFHNADAEGVKTNWPSTEIDENAARYIDFAVTAPSTMDVRLTGISMMLAAHSTSAMCCHINTGFGDDLNGVQTIFERKNFTNKTIEHLALTPILTIPAGETLHVRILPWHENTSGSGKYICVKDVLIEGQAFEPSDNTALEGTVQQGTPNKIIVEGQVVIVRDGVRYNALGVKL